MTDLQRYLVEEIALDHAYWLTSPLNSSVLGRW